MDCLKIGKFFKNIKSILEYVSISNHQYKSKVYPKTSMGQQMFMEIVAKFNNTNQKVQLIDSLINLAKFSTEYYFNTNQKIWLNIFCLRKYHDSIDQHSFTREQICIDIPNYGTRTHSIILVDYDNHVTINEKTMKCPINSKNPVWEETNIEFNLDPLENKN